MKKNEKQAKNGKLPAFYIALCCCVLAIGAAGYISQSFEASKVNTVVENAEESTPIPIVTITPTIEPLPTLAETEVMDNEPETLDAAAIIEEEIPLQEDYTFENPDIEAVNAPAVSDKGFTMPIEGELLQLYSQVPYYDAIMRDWRTHNGIDIAAAEGTEVYCPADGEITMLRTTVFGEEVTISHNDGYETVYSQIIPKDNIAEGNNIRRGDIIGTVTACKGEPISEPHLHFEMKKDGMYVDPEQNIN